MSRAEFRRGRAGRLAGAAVAVLVILAGYWLVFRGRVEIVNESDREIAGATLVSCGDQTQAPFAAVPFRTGVLRAHPDKLCPGGTTIRIRYADGTIASCSSMRVDGQSDWRVILGQSGGCGGFAGTLLAPI